MLGSVHLISINFDQLRVNQANRSGAHAIDQVRWGPTHNFADSYTKGYS